jgi:small subunit ribosomal protein S8
MITVTLKYGRDRASAIIGMKRLSRPGRRLYVRHEDLTKVMSGMGISIISTSRGLLTNRQAEQERVGGELLCEVW